MAMRTRIWRSVRSRHGELPEIAGPAAQG
jgi:hypothetical protein